MENKKPMFEEKKGLIPNWRTIPEKETLEESMAKAIFKGMELEEKKKPSSKPKPFQYR